MKRTEIVTKLIAGTAAFYLGKKVIAAPGLAIARVADARVAESPAAACRPQSMPHTDGHCMCVGRRGRT